MQKNIKRFFLIFLGALTFAAILQTNLLAKEDKKEVNSVTDKLTAEQPAEKSSTENTKMMEKKPQDNTTTKKEIEGSLGKKDSKKDIKNPIGLIKM